MKIFSEEQLLDERVRKQIITGILSNSNQARKNEAKRRHEVFKDQTMKYVMKKLENEGLKPQTLTLMQNRAANISVAKKIVNKKAKAYKHGVSRDAGNEFVNNQVSLLADLLDFNVKQKKIDRYLHLQRNSLVMFLPEVMDYDEQGKKYGLKMNVLSPWQYDVVENPRDRDCPLAVILSDYFDPKQSSVIRGGRNQVQGMDAVSTTEGQSAIAEGASVVQSQAAEAFIFWSNKYHFTCDRNGAIIANLSPEDNLNPIGQIPGLAMAKERDEGFWAGGGEDLIDGAILINTQLTDMNAILFMQGWGQLVITGPKGCVPKQMEMGPHHAMVLTTKPNEKEAKVTVVSSNPPIDGWMKAIEQYAALLLSTNNMAPSSMAAKLDASSFPSGIAMLFEQAESTEDVTDAQHDFAVAEKREWKIISAWYNYYSERKALCDEFAVVGPLPQPDQFDVSVKFNPASQFITEKERLENMKLKKDLGIVRQVELIMEENPSLTEADAMEKLKKIVEERVVAQQRIAKELAGAGVNQQMQNQGVNNGSGGANG